MPDIETPQFDLPFRLDADGKEVPVNEQDSVEDVGDCVEAILRTPLGFFEDDPDFGYEDPTFTEGRPEMEEVQTAIMLNEERAEVLIEESPDLLNQFVSRVHVNVEVASDA